MTLSKLSRRTVLAGAAAAIPAAGVPVAALATSGSDAELLRLVAESDEAKRRFDQIADEADRREEVFISLVPERPAELKWGPHYAGLGVGHRWDGKNRLYCIEADIERLRNEGARRYGVNRLHRVEEWEPWPEGQKRADILIAAYDKWCAARKRAEQQSGVNDLEQAHDAAYDEYRRLVTQLINTPAVTLAGMRAKMAFVVQHYWDGNTEDGDSENTEDRLVTSLARDMAAA